MTTRLLPPEEWPRLAGTELEEVWPILDPTRAAILVIEEGETIVGCWAAIWYLHVECVWIAPTSRGKGSVARRLLSGMRQLVQDSGERTVITGAVTEDVRRLLVAHLGAVAMPEQFVVPMGVA